MKKKDIIKLVKESIQEVRGHYGQHDYYGNNVGGRNSISGMPGVWEEFKVLKELTAMGQEGIYPRQEEPGDMFQQQEVEELLPNGMASRNDRAFQDRLKQHADWTEESGYNNTFVHIQYHDSFDREHSYRIHQSQNFNSNYKDFRNPKFTVLTIDKIKDGKEEELGRYIVDTDAYLKDFQKLRNDDVLGKQVSESLKESTCRQKSQELADSYSVKELQARLNQIMREMEQEAEPEGGPIADMYADEIEAYEGAIKIAKGDSGKGDVPYDVAVGKMTQDEYDKYMSTIAKDKDAFTKSSKFDRLHDDYDEEEDEIWEQAPPGGAPPPPPGGGASKGPIDPDAEAEKKEIDDLEKEKFNVKIKYLNKKKAKASTQAAKQSSQAMKQIQTQIQQMLQQRAKVGTQQKPQQKENKIMKTNKLLSDYLNNNKNVNLKSKMNEHRKQAKRQMLMEGALKQFFEMFDMGRTDEEIVQDYASKGVSVPEQFVGKARKQYESLTKLKTELEMSEKEFKNSAENIVNNPATNEMDGTVTDGGKQMSSGLFGN